MGERQLTALTSCHDDYFVSLRKKLTQHVDITGARNTAATTQIKHRKKHHRK